MPTRIDQSYRVVFDPVPFCEHLTHIRLRPYQMEPFRAIWQSVFDRAGRSFVIIFSRQSGKDELIANLMVFLLMRLYHRNASIVCAQPTFKPQTLTAMDRLDSRMSSPWFKLVQKRSAGYIYKFGRARLTYFSADQSAHVVGATANALMVVNEAQDIDPAKFDKDFLPMCSSGNATKLFSGTSWTSTTLLARVLRLARQAQSVDGVRRFIHLTRRRKRTIALVTRHLCRPTFVGAILMITLTCQTCKTCQTC